MLDLNDAYAIAKYIKDAEKQKVQLIFLNLFKKICTFLLLFIIFF